MTQEETLRTTIGTVLMPTSTTRLRRVAWINLHNLDTLPLGFVGQKALELGKAPRMETPFRLHIFLFKFTPGYVLISPNLSHPDTQHC